jgi:serpin B
MREFDEFKEELLRRKAERQVKDRRKRRLIGSVCVVLCLSMLVGVVMRPTTKVQALDLMDGIRAQRVEGKEPDAAFQQAQYAFALELFRACREKDGENVLVSPLSVMLALAMTANGAQGETLAQMERVLGLPIEDLNPYLKTYVNQLKDNWRTKIHIANSIWFREGLDVNRDFLQTNANYYDANAYASAFDAQTVKDINTWVSENTDGMIDGIVERIESNAIMYLVNALCFEAEWKRGLFEKNKTVPGKFYDADGNLQTVTKMESAVDLYLRTEQAKGFVKEYSGGKYKFVALMPIGDVTLDQFLSKLTAQTLHDMLDNAQAGNILTWIPEYTVDYETELKRVLADMGMPEAFDPSSADFSGLLDAEGVYIGEVIHKTHIAVNAEGTKAAAATEVALKTYGPTTGPTYNSYVDLDRPFLYMIVDGEHNIPLFIGTVDHVN